MLLLLNDDIQLWFIEYGWYHIKVYRLVKYITVNAISHFAYFLINVLLSQVYLIIRMHQVIHTPKKYILINC